MRVVFVLPPTNAEALHEVAPEHSREVTVRPVLEHLISHKVRVGCLHTPDTSDPFS